MDRLIAYNIPDKKQFEKEAIAEGFEMFVSYRLKLLKSQKAIAKPTIQELSGIQTNNHALGQMDSTYFVVYPKAWVKKEDRRERSRLIKMCDRSSFRA
jgi:hypothetical protein